MVRVAKCWGCRCAVRTVVAQARSLLRGPEPAGAQCAGATEEGQCGGWECSGAPGEGFRA